LLCVELEILLDMMNYFAIPGLKKETEISLNDYWKCFKKHYPKAAEKRRIRESSEPRFFFYKIMRDRGFVWSEIGRVAGGYDHSTVINGYHKAESMIELYKSKKALFEEVKKKLS
jgi:hypothetical protein